MPLRFRRSIRLGPGVRLNIGKKSMSVSVGARGMHRTISTTGRHTTSFGLPGTGLSYRQTSRSARKPSRRKNTVAGASDAPNLSPRDVLPKPGIFAAQAEKRFHEGIHAYLAGDLAKALIAFEAASSRDDRNISDDLFAGITAARLGDSEKAIGYLERVIQSDIALPDHLMSKYLPPELIDLKQTISITERVTVSVPVSSLAAALALAELYQTAGRLEEAIGLIQQMAAEAAANAALKLSLCDLLFQDGDFDGVVTTVTGVDNDSDVSLACLHLKGRALAQQGMPDAALEMLSTCLKRTAGRDPELLKDVRYDRAALYDERGQHARARKDWEKLYSLDPAYKDVKERIAPN